MGQIYHGCARTMKEIRRTIQESKESIMKLSVRYHLNLKTVQKWIKSDYMWMTHQWVQKIHIPRFSGLKKK